MHFYDCYNMQNRTGGRNSKVERYHQRLFEKSPNMRVDKRRYKRDNDNSADNAATLPQYVAGAWRRLLCILHSFFSILSKRFHNENRTNGNSQNG